MDGLNSKTNHKCATALSENKIKIDFLLFDGNPIIDHIKPTKVILPIYIFLKI